MHTPNSTQPKLLDSISEFSELLRADSRLRSVPTRLKSAMNSLHQSTFHRAQIHHHPGRILLPENSLVRESFLTPPRWRESPFPHLLSTSGFGGRESFPARSQAAGARIPSRTFACRRISVTHARIPSRLTESGNPFPLLLLPAFRVTQVAASRNLGSRFLCRRENHFSNPVRYFPFSPSGRFRRNPCQLGQSSPSQSMPIDRSRSARFQMSIRFFWPTR